MDKPMKISAAGRTWIAKWESTILYAYDDFNEQRVPLGGHARGTLTIGTGHTSAAGPPHVSPGMVITPFEADRIFAADLGPVEHEVARLIRPQLDQAQFDAVAGFEYNTGWLAHPHCSLTNALNAGKMGLAAEDFALYNKSKGRVMRGLVRRRHAEMVLFTTGKYVGP